MLDASGFTPSGGQLQIGSEILGYSFVSDNIFTITDRGETFGVARQKHLLGDMVTNQAYVIRARAVTGVGTQAIGGAESAIKMYRVDISPPTVPTKMTTDQEISGQPSKSGVYTVRWTSVDPESGIHTLMKFRNAKTMIQFGPHDPYCSRGINSSLSVAIVSIGNKDIPSNVPKETGHFYTYRVRSINQAGATSPWSSESAAAATGLPSDTITQVTNYPNPVDTRQGPTHVSYILNAPSSVKITVFDLLGYEIRTWQFSAGASGGMVGPNVFDWDGTDDAGRHVAAGGYIMRIEVVGDKGSIVVLRKIGIIN